MKRDRVHRTSPDWIEEIAWWNPTQYPTGVTMNLLPGLPLIESPLFPMLKTEMGLTPDEERIANDLFERGYAIFDFPDSDIDERIARVKADLAPRYGVDLDIPEGIKNAGERRIQDA